MAVHSPTTARKGDIQKGCRGAVKCLNRPQEGPANWPNFAIKIFGRPYTRGGLLLSPLDINLKKFPDGSY
jgi:hypothetical protein